MANDKSLTALPAPARAGGAWPQTLLVPLGLLWIAGAALRMTVLAVPPLLPAIHADLNLSETEIGTLSGLPALTFAAAAVPGSLLIARFGAKAALIAGLILNALASATRGAATDALTLFAATIAMGAGIAVMQPALPPLVRNWLPDRIGLATATYTNGLLFGEVFAVSLTLPYVLPLAGGNWRLAIAFWGVPVVLIALLVALMGPNGREGNHNLGFNHRPHPGPPPQAGEGEGEAFPSPPPQGEGSRNSKWWPDWRDPRTWRLGFLFGAVNSIYFSSNAFLPEYLNHVGAPELISPSLAALNMGQLPASLIMLTLAGRLMRQPWAYALSGLCALASIAGLLLTTGAWLVFWAGMVGFTDAVAFVLILALPPLLSAPDDVHRTAAGMFTISYSCAVLIPIIGGLAWDASGIAMVAFAPIALCALVICALPFGIDFRRQG